MKKTVNIPLILAVITAVISFSLTIPAKADKPSGHDGRHHGNPNFPPRHRDRGRHGYQSQAKGKYHGGKYFSGQDRITMDRYFAGASGHDHCPPGLSKHGHGCMPPGQAKKWRIGQVLPPDIDYRDLPPDALYALRPPPPGYRFVQVANDILLIAIGTGMVMDALSDLGSR